MTVYVVYGVVNHYAKGEGEPCLMVFPSMSEAQEWVSDIEDAVLQISEVSGVDYDQFSLLEGNPVGGMAQFRTPLPC